MQINSKNQILNFFFDLESKISNKNNICYTEIKYEREKEKLVEKYPK